MSDLREKLEELVAKWREHRDTCKAYRQTHLKDKRVEAAEFHRGGSEAFERCAERIEALLRETEEEPPFLKDASMQDLINAGLNAFGLQLFAESIAGKKDAKTFRPFSFKYRNIKIRLEPDGEVDTRHH